MLKQTVAVAVLGTGLVLAWPLAFAQGRAAAMSQAQAPAATEASGETQGRRSRTRFAGADARVCLDFPSNPQVIACAEKYRPDRARE